jgi:hypothetical protein
MTQHSATIIKNQGYNLNVTLTPITGARAIQGLWHIKIEHLNDGIAPYSYEFCLEKGELDALSSLFSTASDSSKNVDLASGEYTHVHTGDNLGI